MQSLVHIVYGSRGATTESTQIKHILWSSLRLQQERSWSPWGTIQGAQPISLWAKERQRKLKVSWKIWDKSKFRPANAFWDWAGTQAKRSQSSGWIYDIIDSNVSMHEKFFQTLSAAHHFHVMHTMQREMHRLCALYIPWSAYVDSCCLSSPMQYSNQTLGPLTKWLQRSIY